jgi:hypothetical protein
VWIALDIIAIVHFGLCIFLKYVQVVKDKGIGFDFSKKIRAVMQS